MKTSAHIPELDGIRGIAVLMVLVYHGYFFSFEPSENWAARLASFGISGVDLFFVLSGFLITGILLDAKGRPGYFRNFYARRALRIWPLYYLLLVLSFGLAPLLLVHFHLHPGELQLIEDRNKFVYIFLLQNLWYGAVVGPKVVAVTWSLAVEEQFYIAWPWLVFLCSRKVLAWISAAMFVLSPFVRYWAWRHGVNLGTMAFVTWFRLDGLSLGALLALYRQSTFFSLRHMKWLALAALAAGVPPSMWILDGHSNFLWPALYSALAVGSVGAVSVAIWCSQTDSIFRRALRSGWLRYSGKISYCLYLVHVPVYYGLVDIFARSRFGAGTGAAFSLMVAGMVGSFIVATLSWYLFESQILKLKTRLQYTPQA
ncbi:MAG: acyltransferase [Acidobacteriia bacterium]|nr:acyltransferase [Terriglobia bacterium]